jgi:prolyl-tRNA synthetase
VLRMSTLFLRTLREDPADAEVPSHRLLVRAGYVRRVAPGVYSWLPLGVRMLQRVSRVVREEMDRIGRQEVLFPALLPSEPYEASGRWTEYGDLLFRLKDRRGNDYLLGPTHEELFTLMVKGEYSSYKDLPGHALPGPDEVPRRGAAPRASCAGREFVMKDSYSFDLDDEGLQRSYDLHRGGVRQDLRAARHGLPHRVGRQRRDGRHARRRSSSRPAPTGEDTFVSCTSCDYGRQHRGVQLRAADPQDPASQPPLEVLDTPDTPTIDDAGRRPARPRLRTSTPRHAEERRRAAALAPTARPPRWSSACPATRGRRQAARGQRHARRGAARSRRSTSTPAGQGLHRPQGLEGVRYVVDPLVVQGSAWATGANEPGKHASTSSWAATSSPPTSCPPPRCRAATLRPLRRAARDRPRHRDRPHLPARPQVRRRLRPRRPRARQQAGRVTMGLVRHRRLARDRGHRRAVLRREGPGLARVGRARRRRTSSASASRTSRRSPSASPPSSRAAA